MVSRMVDQKGFDLVAALANELPSMDASFVVLGVSAGPAYGALVGVPSFILMIGISALEILVAGIQAYVFALLSSLYIHDAEHLH